LWLCSLGISGRRRLNQANEWFHGQFAVKRVGGLEDGTRVRRAVWARVVTVSPHASWTL
jgi:hypothetical protein